MPMVVMMGEVEMTNGLIKWEVPKIKMRSVVGMIWPIPESSKPFVIPFR